MHGPHLLLPLVAIFFIAGLELLARGFLRRLPPNLAVVWMCFAGGAVLVVLTDRSGLVASLGLDRHPLLSSVLVFWLFLTAVNQYQTLRKRKGG